jgi:hypothetical protein
MSPKSPVKGSTALRIVMAMATVVLLALGGRSWLASRDAAIELRATLAAQDQLIRQAEVRQQDREEKLAKSIATIAAEKRSVRTPAQAAAKISAILPPLPAPIRFELPRPNSPPIHSRAGDVVPPSIARDPPTIFTIPQEDLKPLHDYLQDCRACQLQLAAANDNLTDERAKIAALIVQRDSASSAASGGSFWSRARSAVKWLIVGGTLGAVAASAAHN